MDLSRFQWYLHRLRTMSPREMLQMRLYRGLRNRLFTHPPEIPDECIFTVQPFTDSLRKTFLERFPETVPRTVTKAEGILHNRLILFGVEHQFGDEIAWHQDYITRINWPQVPVSKLDYRQLAAGDPKIVWELNRHGFLPTLGKAFFLTGKEKYAAKAISTIRSWIDANPPFTGVNWTSGIELAIRQLNWLWTLRFIWRSASLAPSDKEQIQHYLFYQTDRIFRNLSLFSSANNHLISELAALACVGYVLGQKGWMRRAGTLLEEQISNQIFEDGVGAEQSPSYQAHTMEFYVLAALSLEEAGIPLSSDTLMTLYQGSKFLSAILEDSGYPPAIGDNDSGIILDLCTNSPPYQSLVNQVLILAGTSRAGLPNLSDDEKTFWVMGQDRFDAALKHPITRRTRKKAYPVGGYYILEQNLASHHVRVLFDCGPLGMKPLAGHGHADALQVLLWVDGKPTFIDPGTYTYFGDDHWRSFFRGTSAHNTARLDEKDQSLFGGRFLALNHAYAECLDFHPDRYVTGQHLGYSSLACPVVHQRMVAILPENDCLTITDRFHTAGMHTVELFWHIENSCVIGKPIDSQLTLGDAVMTFDPGLTLKLINGDSQPPLGWRSTMYKKKEPITTIRAKVRINGTTDLVTTLSF